MNFLPASAQLARSALDKVPVCVGLWATAFLLGLMGYTIALGSGFLADDYVHFFNLMADGQPKWSHAVQHWITDKHTGVLRPIATAYELTLVSLFGVEPLPMRLVGLALHAANAALVGLIVLQLEAPLRSAYLAAALAATAPLGPEAVTYVAANPGVLCAFFGLFSILWSLRWMTYGNPKALFAAGAGLALALASKEEGLAFLAMIGGVGLWAALGAVIVDRRGEGAKNALRAGALITLAAIALLGYYYWRLAALGSWLPAYYSTSSDYLGTTALSIRNVLLMIAQPTNLEHLGDGGALANRAVGMTYFLGIAGALFAYRQRVWPLLLFLGFLVAAVIPAHAVLSFSIDSGLTNSRFAYLSTLVVAGAAGMLVAGRRRLALSGVVRNAGVVVVGVLIGLHVLVLAANNHAWRHAADTLERIRVEAAVLSGGDPTMPIVNLPDRIDGVFAGRSGWPFFRFAPFDPAAFPWREQRTVLLALAEPAYTTATAASNGTGWSLEPTEFGEGPTQVKLWFDPEKPGSAELALEARSTETDCLMARIIASGRSERNAFTMTALAGTAIVLSRSKDRIIVGLGVADAADGTPARSLLVRLPPGAPWSLDVRDGDGKPLDHPLDLDDGATVNLSLTLTRLPDVPEWPAIALFVGARNAHDIPTLGAVHLSPIDVAPGVAMPESTPGSAHAGIYPATCDSPAQISVDFGLVPLNGGSFFTAAPPRPVNSPERPLLFWDDVASEVRLLAEVYAKGTVAAWSAGELRSWQAVSADLEQSWPAPDRLAFLTRSPGLTLISPELHLESSAVTHLLVEMRLVGVPSPYAYVGWTAANSRDEEGLTSFVTHPDGRWRTYAVPLHDEASWHASDSVAQIRLALVGTAGYVEVRRVALVDLARL